MYVYMYNVQRIAYCLLELYYIIHYKYQSKNR